MGAEMIFQFLLRKSILIEPLLEKSNIKGVVFPQQRVSVELPLFLGELFGVRCLGFL